MSDLLDLLQLASPALPLGGYNYSEGLETLVERGQVEDAASLRDWLELELREGAIAVDAAVVLRGARCAIAGDLAGLAAWNHWLNASRDARELQEQGQQMGNSLLRLLADLEEASEITPEGAAWADCRAAVSPQAQLAIAYGIAIAQWNLSLPDGVLGYLHSWATNLIGAGVKLIPLGQTSGQRLIRQLQPTLRATRDRLLTLADDDLIGCTWGLSLASMQHETLYTRLFRS